MSSPGPFSVRLHLRAIRSAAVRTVVCCVAFGGLAACDSAVEPEDAIQVNTRVSRTTLSVNDSVTVHVTAVNHGNRVVSASLDGCPNFAIRKQGQEIDIIPDIYCSAIGARWVDIQPGDSATVKSDWVGTRLTRQAGAGTYSLAGRVMVKFAILQSAPVTVQVVP